MTNQARKAGSAGSVPAELIGEIYASVGNNDCWPRLLEQLARFLSADTALVQVFDQKLKCATQAVGFGFDDDFLSNYRNYSGLNVWMIRGAHLMRPGGLILSHEMYPEDLLAKTELYGLFLEPAGIFYSMGAVLKAEGGVSVTVSVQRGRDHGRFGGGDKCKLSALSPHLRNAFDLQRRIKTAENRSRSIEELLDCQPGAVLLIGRGGMLVHANHAARRLLESHSGLNLTGQRIAAAVPEENALLRRLLETSVTPSDGRGMCAGGAIKVSRPHCRQPLHLRVIPLMRTMHEWEDSEPLFAVFVSDPSAEPRGGAEALRRGWRLTPAEARLAMLLVRGRDPGQAADELGVSIHTVRCQLKSLFAKTETRRQSELVLALLAILNTGCEGALDPESPL